MKGSSALGAKTARACDSCLRIRARWFCAADDAFLCHGCDNLVHSANQLAKRHERVRLQTTSSNKVTTKTTTQAWHSGFTRKARTPRQNNKHFLVQQQRKEEHEEVIFNNNSVLLPLVPELGNEDQLLLDDDETEDQMLCRVPVFDPFEDSELCSVYNEVKNNDEEEAFDLENFSELLPSDVDLAEFAADVESLLDEDSGDVKGQQQELENIGCKEEEEDAFVAGEKGAMVKVKEEEELDDDIDIDMDCNLDSILDMSSEAFEFDWSIDSESMVVVPHELEEKVPVVEASGGCGESKVETTKKERFLRLNYEKVIAAWTSQGSPWTTGNPPKLHSYDCWPDYLGSSGADVQCSYGELRRGNPRGGDGGREARVSRYREKRRTRLFAKKIRYEVRKLNAEKRPRMKGRFVKRTSFVGATATATFPAQLPLTSK